MFGTIELRIITTERCPGCQRAHQIRVALMADRDQGEQLVGFFGRCPDTGRRVWLVLRAPVGMNGRSGLLRMGPLDDIEWEPAESAEPMPGVPAAVATLPSSPQPAATVPELGTASERLRRALGCPHSVPAGRGGFG